MTAVIVREPPVNYVSKGAAAHDGLLINPAKQLWILSIAQAPTNGTSGDGAGFMGPGSILIRTDTPQLYQNTNTLLSPTWTQIS